MVQLMAPQSQNKSRAFQMDTRLDLMRARADAALAQEAFTATHSAIVAVKAAAAFHRRAYHTRHIPKPFQEALDCLDLQITGNRAALSKAESEILSVVDVIYLHEVRFGELDTGPYDPLGDPDGPCNSAFRVLDDRKLNFHVFCTERIVDNTGKVVATGSVVHVSGPEELVRSYFHTKTLVWTCTSPMIGDWSQFTPVSGEGHA